MNDLKKLFQKDERIFSDGKLLKNKLTELTLKLDQLLIELLLSDKKAKEHFFIEKPIRNEKVLVFDKDKFIAFINNKEFLPDSFTSFKNKIGLMTNGDYLKEKNDVVLAWPYKDCVLEGGQDKEDQKRDEIFYNETLSPDEIDRLFEPKVLTNFKKYDVKGEHKVTEFKIDDNLIIKGNNLLALHCLKKKYRGKVKLIYIDPPFNREADTFYNDKFRHSTWMTFMRNRFAIAKDFLQNDGFICVHLDDIEMAYCKVLMDEIFGKSNYRNTIALKTNDPSGFKATGESIFSTANYILVYSKDGIKPKMEKVYIETPYDPMYNKVLLNKYDSYKKWKWVNINEHVAQYNGYRSTKEAKKALGDEFNVLVEEYALNNADSVFRTAAIGGGARKKRLDTIEKSKKHKDVVFVHPNEDIENFYILNGEGIVFYQTKVFEINNMKLTGAVITDVWSDISWTGIANEGNVTLKNGKKPEKLMQRIIYMLSKKNDLILDYHAGSGTTLAVAHKMNRRYIGIEQLNYGGNDCLTRLKNVISGDRTGISKDVNWQGGGSFIYTELVEWNEKYIQDIKETDTTRKLLNIYEKMKNEAFFRYDIDLSNFDEKEFSELPIEEQKQILCECLDKNHLYVNLSEIDDAMYRISADDKKLNKEFYEQSM